MGAHPESLLGSAYVTSLIQIKANQMSRKPGFCRSDEEELVQQLKTHLLEQAEHYDPSRGASVETFANRVILTAVAMILRDRRRLKRAAGFTAASLETGTINVDGKDEALSDAVSDADKARITGTASSDPQIAAELAEAVEHALAALPPAVAAVGEALKRGDSVAVIAAKLNMSKRDVRAAKDQIGRHFRLAGLAPGQ
jgi:DNA-directed RNA polymerase specialized sigma24 family protein